jgi:hypothetical protein
VGFEKVFLPLSVSRLYYGGNHGDGWGTDGNEKYLQQLYQLWTKITGEDPNGFNIPLRLVEHNTQPSNYTTINLASGKSVVNGIINQKFVEDALGREPNRPYQLALYSDKKSDEYINIWAGEPTDQLYTVGVPQALKSVFDNTGYKYRFDMNGSLTPFDWTLLFDITDECFITIPIVPNYGLMMIGAHLGGKDINFVLDTGASITTLNESRKDDLIASRAVIATSRNIETIDAEGELTQHKIYLIRELEIASSNGKFLYNDIEIVFTGGENLLGANVWENWKDFGINQEDNYILIKQ